MAVDLVFEGGEVLVKEGFALEGVAQVAFEFFVVGHAAGGGVRVGGDVLCHWLGDNKTWKRAAWLFDVRVFYNCGGLKKFGVLNLAARRLVPGLDPGSPGNWKWCLRRVFDDDAVLVNRYQERMKESYVVPCQPETLHRI